MIFFTGWRGNSQDKHVLRQPTLFTPHGRSNPQSKAFFTKKRITAIARTKGPNLSGLWVVHDVLAWIVWPHNILFAMSQRFANRVHTVNKLAVLA